MVHGDGRPAGEHGGDTLYLKLLIDAEQHPCTERFKRRHVGGEALFGLRQTFYRLRCGPRWSAMWASSAGKWR